MPVKNDVKYFLFNVKSSYVLEKFKLLSWLFGYAENRLDKKGKINFKIYDFTNWATNNYNIYIVQYIQK